MKKIAVVDLLFNWPPDGGGRVDIMEICSRLARLADIKLFVPDFPKFFPRGQVNGEIPFPLEKMKFSKKEFNVKCLAETLRQRLQEFRPDIVFIADGYFLKPYISYALKGYRYVLRYYAYEPICILKSGKYFRSGRVCNGHFLNRPFSCLVCAFCSFGWRPGVFAYEFYKSRAFLPRYRYLIEDNLRSATSIIVYNKIIKDLISGYNHQVVVIPSGVDTSKFYPSKGAAEGNVILMVGRTRDPLKGFSLLCKAIDIIRQRGKDISLLVTDDRKFKERYIMPTSWLGREELPALYHKATICVVPSLWPEPFGIVAIEAMACGLPVIASNTGGLKEIINDGVDGLLFQPGNLTDLVEKIEYLLDNKTLRQKLGEAARRKACINYDWDRIFENYYRKIFEL